eukprot:2940208-Rhodomonas_salina.2
MTHRPTTALPSEQVLFSRSNPQLRSEHMAPTGQATHCVETLLSTRYIASKQMHDATDEAPAPLVMEFGGHRKHDTTAVAPGDGLNVLGGQCVQEPVPGKQLSQETHVSRTQSSPKPQTRHSCVSTVSMCEAYPVGHPVKRYFPPSIIQVEPGNRGTTVEFPKHRSPGGHR